MATIKEVIEQLKKYPNQDAELNIIVNVVNEDDEEFDIQYCAFECWQQDVEDADVYDFFIYGKEKEE